MHLPPFIFISTISWLWCQYKALMRVLKLFLGVIYASLISCYWVEICANCAKTDPIGFCKGLFILLMAYTMRHFYMTLIGSGLWDLRYLWWQSSDAVVICLWLLRFNHYQAIDFLDVFHWVGINIPLIYRE